MLLPEKTTAMLSSLVKEKIYGQFFCQQHQEEEEEEEKISNGCSCSPVITHIDMPYSDMGDEGAEEIALTLCNHHDHPQDDENDYRPEMTNKGLNTKEETLSKLNLYWNNISCVGAQTIGQALLEGTVRLTELNLGVNRIGDIGVEAIAKGLAKSSLSTLIKLDLEGNEIGDVGIEALCEHFLQDNRTIQSINLFDNRIGVVGCERMGEILCSAGTALLSLNLGKNGFGDDGASEIAKGLQDNTTVSRLVLEGNGIGNEGATALANGLRNNSSLCYLSLFNNTIGMDGCCFLGQMLMVNMSLATLDLGLNVIDDDGAWGLAMGLEENHSLRELDLQGNHHIGERGVQALADIGLPYNTTLTKLDLSSSTMSEQAYQSLVEALKVNLTVTDVGNLRYTVCDEPTHAFREANCYPDAQFYLTLNRAGRYPLLVEENNDAEWIETFIQYRYQTSVVFYFLSLRPELCRTD